MKLYIYVEASQNFETNNAQITEFRVMEDEKDARKYFDQGIELFPPECSLVLFQLDTETKATHIIISHNDYKYLHNWMEWKVLGE